MSKKRTFRTGKSAELPFTRADNRLLNDDSLSFGARGVMCYLLSKPDTWVLVKENLVNSSPAGSTAINSILDELEAAGYIKSERGRTSTGKYRNSVFLIYEHKSLYEPTKQDSASDLPQRLIHDGKSDMDKPATVNLRLVTNDSSNKRKETTTPTTDLIWPTKVKVSPMQQQSILRMIGGVDSEIIQNFLDEMQNTTKIVRNPVAYFHDLLIKHKNGNYTRSGAIAESEKRVAKEKTDERVEAMKQESIRRGEEFIEKYSKALPE